MANATDDLKLAEKIIEGIIYGQIEKERALQICRWLISFNTVEKGFTVKCYQTKVPDVRFCIDRGHDCEGKRILTVFATIRSNLQILFYAKNILPYFKIGNTGVYYIVPEDGRRLDMEVIKKHIFESYEMRINELNLVSNVSSTYYAPQEIHSQSQDGSYQPTREEIEKILREIAPKGKEIDEEELKRRIEFAFVLEKRKLKPGWWEEAKRNLVEWSNKG